MSTLEMLGFGTQGWGYSLLRAAGVTLALAVLGFCMGSLLGVLVAWAKLSRNLLISKAAMAYTTVLRGVPDLLVIYLFYFGGSIFLGYLGRLAGISGFVEAPPFVMGVLALGFISAAYQAEVFRGAYMTVPRGEIEAAVAIGMSRMSMFRRIVAPLVLRYALPGLGNARGSQDRESTFEFLVNSAERASFARINPVLLAGFIQEVQTGDPLLARKLLEASLDHPKLSEHFVCLLCAAPLEPWGVKKLIELTRDGALEAWTFTYISLGRVHEAISDDDLAELLDALLVLPDGISAVLQILEMRSFIEKDNSYRPNEIILSAGRRAIKNLMAMHRDNFRPMRSHGFDRVCAYCLRADAPREEVAEIAELVFDGIESYRLYSFELNDVIRPLVRNFPELVLDSIFVGGQSEALRSDMVFCDRSYDLDEVSLNEASIDRLLDWCGGDQERLVKLAGLVCPFTTVEGGGAPLENPKKVKMGDHMTSLLDAVDDKASVVEAIFARTWPSGWSGSLADILEVRALALEELSEHPSTIVQKMVVEKLKEISRAVLRDRASEAEESNRQEQRFE